MHKAHQNDVAWERTPQAAYTERFNWHFSMSASNVITKNLISDGVADDAANVQGYWYSSVGGTPPQNLPDLRLLEHVITQWVMAMRDSVTIQV